MRSVARRAWALWCGILLLAGGMGYFLWSLYHEGETWVLHKGNPHLYAGATGVAMGTVVDMQGQSLLRLTGGRVYASDPQIRCATMHWLGDRSGNVRGTVLQTYARELAGYSFAQGLYGYGGGGSTMELTLSAAVQAAALEAMGDYSGTVAVCNYRTGQILCAVTTPTFDPDGTVGTQEGIFLNRFTQATYVPGSIFKIVTTAAALEYLPDAADITYNCDGSYYFGADRVTCERAHGRQDLAEALKNSCNCYFASLSEILGAAALEAYVVRSGVLESVRFDGIQTAQGNLQIRGVAPVSLAWSAIGQHKDLINPCSFLTYVCAIANGGQGPLPYIVQRIYKGDRIYYTAQVTYGQRILSQEYAGMLTDFLRNNVENGYGQESFPVGMTVCAKSGTGQVDGKKSYAMFVGFVLEERYPLAFLVAAEDAGYGKTVCMPIVAKVLQACKQVLDSQA